MPATEGSPSTATTGTTPTTGVTPDPSGTPGTSEQTTGTGGGTPQEQAGSDDLAGLRKALAAERDAKRQAEQALKSLQQQQTEGQAQTQTLEQRVQELEAAKQKAERETLALRIATETGLPSEMAARLFGMDEKSLREDAEKLKAAVTASAPQTPTPVGGPQGQPVGNRSPEDWITVLRQKR